jgi:hypothetical protein
MNGAVDAVPHEILEAGAQERDGGAARKSTSYHQETEANQFAIELLAPERMVSRYLRGLPELEQVVAMHTKLDISNTAAARRNVKLHKEPLAVVFATDGAFQYADRGPDFPFIDIKKGQLLPSISGIGMAKRFRRWLRPTHSTGAYEMSSACRPRASTSKVGIRSYCFISTPTPRAKPDRTIPRRFP